jgi:ferredoxin
MYASSNRAGPPASKLARVVRIWIQPRGLSLTAEPGARLVDIVDEQSIASVPLSCRGAHCGICRLRVARGAGCFEPAGRAERETLAAQGAGADERLLCQLWLVRDACGEAELELLNAPSAGG